MSFNYAKEKQKFNREWEKNHTEYAAAGMSEENIQKMKEFDWSWFCSRRRYENRIQALPSEFIGEEEGNEERTTLFCKFLSLSSGFSEADFYDRYGWIEDIENQEIADRLKKFSGDDLELLTLIVIEGYTQSETAVKYGISQKNICKKIKRIKKFLT